MFFKLKKSHITDWWIAISDSPLAFFNILAGNPLDQKLIVVGYFNKKKKELATSTNYVVNVTKDGVITTNGSFYPFEKAHKLYLQFLIEVNKENTLIATNWDFAKYWYFYIKKGKLTITDWEYANTSTKSIIIADIILNNGYIRKKSITFDFIPDQKHNVILSGYSKDLSSKIVLTTFSRRNVCAKISIPNSIKSDIAFSSLKDEEETKDNIRLVQNIFIEKYK